MVRRNGAGYEYEVFPIYIDFKTKEKKDLSKLLFKMEKEYTGESYADILLKALSLLRQQRSVARGEVE